MTPDRAPGEPWPAAAGPNAASNEPPHPGARIVGWRAQVGFYLPAVIGAAGVLAVWDFGNESTWLKPILAAVAGFVIQMAALVAYLAACHFAGWVRGDAVERVPFDPRDLRIVGAVLLAVTVYSCGALSSAEARARVQRCVAEREQSGMGTARMGLLRESASDMVWRCQH